MLEVHLHLFERRGLVGLEFPLPARLTALGGAALLLWLSLASGPPAPFGLALAVLFVLGALYDEQWAFDPEGRHVYFRLGLIGIGRLRRWGFGGIEGLELSVFRKGLAAGATEQTTGYGRSRPRYAVLALRFTDGTRRVLDRRPARQQDVLEALGQRLADATGLALTRDSSW
jgi:hypothetical protein